MVANNPRVIDAQGLKIQIPSDLNTNGRGSGRARAFEFGVLAAMYGHGHDTCPYEALRGSGSFRKQWFRGYDAYNAAKEQTQSKVAS